MTVTVEQLGPFLTAAGRTALSNVEATLRRRPGAWTILTNVCLDAPTDDYHERLHLVIVGPPGVTVCEVRRGDRAFLAGTTEYLEVAALRAKQKAARLGRLLDTCRMIVEVQATLVIDNDDVGGAPSGLFGVQIIPSHQLGKHNNHSDRNYSSDQLQAVIRIIREDHDGHDPSINLGTARGLEIDDMTGAPFHVTFRASDLSANPIIVHVYDLTASDRDDCFQVANRGFEVLDGLAPNTYIPPIVSRLTIYPSVDGEIAWFAIGDDNNPSIAEASSREDWLVSSRVQFCARSLVVLSYLHRPVDIGIKGLVLRDISAQTLHLASSNEPYFSRFRFARYVGRNTIAVAAGPQWQPDDFTAPEVRDGGLGAATSQSDVFSLCASLIAILYGPFRAGSPDEALASKAREILQLGCAISESRRPALQELSLKLEELLFGDSGEATDALESDFDPNFVDDGGEAQRDDERYVRIRKLGRGGLGWTWLIRDREIHEELARDDPQRLTEDVGCLVGKIPLQISTATKIRRSHLTVRPFTNLSPHLSVVHEVSRACEPGMIIAVLQFVTGASLDDESNLLQDLSLDDPELLLSRCISWYSNILSGLSCLHRNRVVHGDISPDNLMLSANGIVVVDYDTVARVGGIHLAFKEYYASTERQNGAPATCSEDVFAAALTIFDCLVGGGLPLWRTARARRGAGLPWPSSLSFQDRLDFHALKTCLDQATAQDPADRYRDATQALEDFQRRMGGEPPPTDDFLPSMPSGGGPMGGEPPPTDDSPPSMPSGGGPSKDSDRSGNRASDPAAAALSLAPSPIQHSAPPAPNAPDEYPSVAVNPRDYLRYFDLVSEILSGQDAGDDGR